MDDEQEVILEPQPTDEEVSEPVYTWEDRAFSVIMEQYVAGDY